MYIGTLPWKRKVQTADCAQIDGKAVIYNDQIVSTSQSQFKWNWESPNEMMINGPISPAHQEGRRVRFAGEIRALQTDVAIPVQVIYTTKSIPDTGEIVCEYATVDHGVSVTGAKHIEIPVRAGAFLLDGQIILEDASPDELEDPNTGWAQECWFFVSRRPAIFEEMTSHESLSGVFSGKIAWNESSFGIEAVLGVLEQGAQAISVKKPFPGDFDGSLATVSRVYDYLLQGEPVNAQAGAGIQRVVLSTGTEASPLVVQVNKQGGDVIDHFDVTGDADGVDVTPVLTDGSRAPELSVSKNTTLAFPPEWPLAVRATADVECLAQGGSPSQALWTSDGLAVTTGVNGLDVTIQLWQVKATVTVAELV